MPNSMTAFLKEKLSMQERSGLLRKLTVTPIGLADFASNDYLGLARSPTLFEKIEEEVRKTRLWNGSTGSRLLTGNSDYIELVEANLADIFSAESTLLFNSGYAANLSVLSTLPQRNDTIIYDELVHASIKDGARLSHAKRFSFRHNDLNDLERKIGTASGRVYIAVESVYSMDGDFCPLREIVNLADEKGACIILDEAHTTGIMGERGSGMAVQVDVARRIPVRVYTFGKGMGVHGACVAGSAELKNYLVNFARPFIYTTAPDTHSVASIRCAFEFLAQNISLQRDVARNIALFATRMKGLGNRPNQNSAIQTLIVPGSEKVRKLASLFQNNGMDVRPILSPTVPAGTERLRICLHAFNSESEIETLCSLLKEYGEAKQE